MDINTIDVIKVLALGALGFLVAFFMTPTLTNFLYKNKLWKKKQEIKE